MSDKNLPNTNTPQGDSNGIKPAFEAPDQDDTDSIEVTTTIAQTPPAPEPLKINYPPLLWKQTQETHQKLQEKLGGFVVSYFASSSIVGDDVKYFYTHLSNIGFQEKIFFVLYTNGGDGKSAYRIASLLKSFCNELIIVVPEMAASAGTMLCLAADKILMTPLSYLTAVDTSIVHALNPKDANNRPVRVELEEVRRAVEILEKNTSDENKYEIYKLIFNYIHPVAYGNISRTSTLSEMLCKDLIRLRKIQPDPEHVKDLITKLNQSLPAHGYPITRDIALEMGLPVEKTDDETNDMLWKYLTLNRALTEPVRTDIDHSHFHIEKVLNVIESVGRRLSVKKSHERRLDPIIKGWSTIKEIYKWYATFEVEENGEKKVVVNSIDL